MKLAQRYILTANILTGIHPLFAFFFQLAQYDKKIDKLEHYLSLEVFCKTTLK